jgi:hypothetical protein
MTSDKDFIGFGLHDAVLEQVVVHWPEGTVVIQLSATTPTPQNVVITATGILQVVCPRHQPWGTGDHVFYVNDVRTTVEPGDPSHTRLEIEMGSGDVLVFVAKHIERVSSPKPGAEIA